MSKCPHKKTLKKKVKAVGKKLIAEIIGKESNAKADKLESQGAVARLLDEEKKDFPWQSVIFASRFPCCVLLALSWNTTNENPSTDKLSRAIN